MWKVCVINCQPRSCLTPCLHPVPSWGRLQFCFSLLCLHRQNSHFYEGFSSCSKSEISFCPSSHSSVAAQLVGRVRGGCPPTGANCLAQPGASLQPKLLRAPLGLAMTESIPVLCQAGTQHCDLAFLAPGVSWYHHFFPWGLGHTPQLGPGNILSMGLPPEADHGFQHWFSLKLLFPNLFIALWLKWSLFFLFLIQLEV